MKEVIFVSPIPSDLIGNNPHGYRYFYTGNNYQAFSFTFWEIEARPNFDSHGVWDTKYKSMYSFVTTNNLKMKE